MTGFKQERTGMEENKQIEWVESEQQWIVWDEASDGYWASMTLIAKQKQRLSIYCLELFADEEE